MATELNNCVQKGISQLKFAVAMENHAEQIGRIERGKHNLSICTLRKIAVVLDISLSLLVDINQV